MPLQNFRDEAIMVTLAMIGAPCQSSSGSDCRDTS
jgi:hypothetical protein